MRAYHLTGSDKPRLRLVERDEPKASPGHVVVDLHAASLNYRDLLQAKGDAGVIPLSDGAGVVSGLGSDAGSWSVGDRVVIGCMSSRVIAFSVSPSLALPRGRSRAVAMCGRSPAT